MKNPNRSKAEIEERIREIARELRALDEHPAVQKKMPLEEKIALHSREWMNLYTEGCGEICLYAMKLYPENPSLEKPSRAARHGELLMKIAHDCFKNFKPESGDFINYLSHTIRTEFTRAEQKELVDEKRGGTKPAEKHIRLAKDFLTLAEGLGKNPHDVKVQEWYCARYGIALEDLQSALRSEYETNVLGENIQTGEGNVASVFDTIASARVDAPDAESASENYTEFFNTIEDCFEKQQARTKPYVSALVTLQLLKEIESREEAKVHFAIADELETCSFADRKMIEAWRHGGDIGSQKDIAVRFKPNLNEDNAESDASRKMRKFWEKVKNCAQKVSSGEDFGYNKQ